MVNMTNEEICKTIAGYMNMYIIAGDPNGLKFRDFVMNAEKWTIDEYLAHYQIYMDWISERYDNWEALEPAIPLHNMSDATIKAVGMDNTKVWKNSIYTVFVKSGIEVGQGHTVSQLAIQRNDKEARPDWRHFQYIKNQLIGPEHEGVELYPAETRLMDTGNVYHLWVFEQLGIGFPFGHIGSRMITRRGLDNGKQRPFPANMIPADLEECEKQLRDMLQEHGIDK